MKLERHVGGLSIARKVRYLRGSGWSEVEGRWQHVGRAVEPVPLSKAIHFQLTVNLTQGLERVGWKVTGYSLRGYARLKDPKDESECSLPAALRRQARRTRLKVADFTYSLFLAALLEAGAEAD